MNAPAELPVDRKRFIGGSDAAAILGVAPSTWKGRCTPLDIYLIKTGQRAEFIEPALARLFKRGKRREPEVVDDLIELYGVNVTKRSTPDKPNRYIDPEHSFLAAEIDFEWEVQPADVERWNLAPSLIGTIQNGEVKTVHPFASGKFGDEETDEIPYENAAQAAHGQMVAGRQITMFAVGVDANDPLVYFLPRDDVTIAAMREKEVEFWNNHILAGVPPKALRFEDLEHLFRKDVATLTEASEEIAALVVELAEVKQKVKAAEEREVEIKFQIGQHMLGQAGIVLKNDGKLVPGSDLKPGKHLLQYHGQPLLTVNHMAQNRIDSDLVRRNHPEVAIACSKHIEFFRFDRPRKKGK